METSNSSRFTRSFVKRSCHFAHKRKKEAQEKAKTLFRSYEFAFRRRYNLPPTDPRFLRATEEEIEVDYWAHVYHDDPKQVDAVVSDDPDFDLNEILEKAESGDWEEI